MLVILIFELHGTMEYAIELLVQNLSEAHVASSQGKEMPPVYSLPSSGKLSRNPFFCVSKIQGQRYANLNTRAACF